jgi:hypothetical protein
MTFAMAAAPAAKAQTLYGTLVGNVTDPSTSPIAGTKVVAVNAATGFSRAAVTDDRGSYLFSDLQPGAYRLNVAPRGSPHSRKQMCRFPPTRWSASMSECSW